MKLTGYDAKTMQAVVDVIDSIKPMNGIVCKYVDYPIERLMVDAGLLWVDEDGDLFEDHALGEWHRRGGDVRELAAMLNLEIEIVL